MNDLLNKQVKCPGCYGEQPEDCMVCTGKGSVTIPSWLENVIGSESLKMAKNVIAVRIALANADESHNWQAQAEDEMNEQHAGLNAEQMTQYTRMKIGEEQERIQAELSKMSPATAMALVSVLNPEAYECLRSEIDPTYVPPTVTVAISQPARGKLKKLTAPLPSDPSDVGKKFDDDIQF